MKLKLVISLLVAVSIPTFFSACTSVESKSSEEVVIDSSSTASKDEVFITNSDVKNQKLILSTIKKNGAQLEKRVLSDKSEIETLVDGLGNKVETRYFSGNPRLRMVIVRTPVKGAPEVTVYGNGGAAKIVEGLADRALTASGDEIANAAQINATGSYGAAKNFMKKNSSATQQQPLQPLPSSSFQQPQTPVYQPVENVRQETSASSEKPAAPQNNPEKD